MVCESPRARTRMTHCTQRDQSDQQAEGQVHTGWPDQGKKSQHEGDCKQNNGKCRENVPVGMGPRALAQVSEGT